MDKHLSNQHDVTLWILCHTKHYEVVRSYYHMIALPFVSQYDLKFVSANIRVWDDCTYIYARFFSSQEYQAGKPPEGS